MAHENDGEKKVLLFNTHHQDYGFPININTKIITVLQTI